MAPAAETGDDFEWVSDPATVMFCVTCVQNMSAEDLLSAVGATRIGDTRWNAEDAQVVPFRQGDAGLRVAPAGEWSVLIEFHSLKGADGDWLREISRERTAVSYYHTGGGLERFSLAVDGEVVTEFEPALAAHRTGSSPDHLVDDMRAVGIDPDGSSEHDHLGPATLELLARLTGVRATSRMVVTERWPAGAIPRRRKH
ncbi:DUF6461 domain-containing protein [Lentzea sp. NBRC 102530]|uniref:DUF6461 domain-containing protein n=1 Tax=Lentzea sp. NBRC 102530 TaxID=3032201 RepID=UPI0024A344D5|nr:DUF6461 domain-containing protein [Lentzea sp. NBRC 102530]GLY47778.1 hypothetical protein Lesp01_14340 [Lentzea sp. NBRC 102530]